MRSLHPRASRLASALLLTIWLSPASLAQNGAPPATVPSVAFPQVTEIPVPFQSISGRWNALNPPSRHICPFSQVTGRVISARLILVDGLACYQGAQTANVLVNLELADLADAAQMVTGRRVVVKASFKFAQEFRAAMDGWANYLIAEKAELVAGDPRGAPAPAFMSYMLCQPPELDALAREPGSKLCVQSKLLANLKTTGPALEAAARTPANLAPDDTVPGDAEAISCRLDPGLSGLHLQAVACARNSYWVWYKEGWGIPAPTRLAPP
jgi:hypothetical protein